MEINTDINMSDPPTDGTPEKLDPESHPVAAETRLGSAN